MSIMSVRKNLASAAIATSLVLPVALAPSASADSVSDVLDTCRTMAAERGMEVRACDDINNPPSESEKKCMLGILGGAASIASIILSGGSALPIYLGGGGAAIGAYLNCLD